MQLCSPYGGLHLCTRLRPVCKASEKANNQAYERFLTNKAKKNGYFVPQTVRLSPEPLHDYIDAFIENIDRNDPSQYSVQWRAPVQQRTAADSSGPGPGSTTDSADGIASGMAMRGVVIAPPEGMRGPRKIPLPPLPPTTIRRGSASSNAAPATPTTAAGAATANGAVNVFLFWDLEALHPEDSDPRDLACEVAALVAAYGQAAGKYVYSVRKGWSWVPTYFLERYGRGAASGAGGSSQARGEAAVKNAGAAKNSNKAAAAPSKAATSAAPASSAAAGAARRNTDRASLGKIAQYANSAGQRFVPTTGHQLSIKYVLSREGFEARLVQNADEAVDRAINGGLEKLLYQVRSRPLPGRLVLMLLSDSTRHAPLLGRCKELGMDVIWVSRGGGGGGGVKGGGSGRGEGAGLSGEAGQARMQMRRHADVFISWEDLRRGSYMLPSRN